MVLLFLLLFWQGLAPPTAQLHGTIYDAQNGEQLSRVNVKLIGSVGLEATTDSSGRFQIDGIPFGQYTVVVSSVGYHLLQKAIELKGDGNISLDLAITPESSAQRKDSVEVQATPFDLEQGHGPTAFTLSGSEARNLASVLADDPMRALQSAPGIAADDDFDSRFTLHGAPYTQLGLYLDGILLHQPFHTVQGEGPSGSTAIFNGDMVATMTLQSEAYGAQYEDRTAGVIDIQTREGSTDRIHASVNVSLPDSGFLVEGPFGRKEHKGSWLVSARKSYLQYFLKDLTQDLPAMAFGFFDTQAQFNYALDEKNSLTLRLIDGTSTLDRSNAKSTLGLNAAEFARYRYSLLHLNWQFTPNHSFVLNSHAAFTEERYENTNALAAPLGYGNFGEWTAKSDATWAWTDGNPFKFGASARPTRGSGFSNYYFSANSLTATDWYHGGAIYEGGYAQQSFTHLVKRLTISLGGRWDTVTANHQSVISAQASVSYAPWAGGRFSVAWGRYAQFPDVDSFFAENGSAHLVAARADHFVATFEQQLSSQTRFRLEAFERNDRDLLWQPLADARLTGGAINPDHFQSALTNSLTGKTKGAEVFIQKRTANGWNGWASYTYSHSEMFDRLTRVRFPSDQDQRHTFNGYLSYRLRPSVNLSAKFTYGSGFPVPGFLTLHDGTYYLGTIRNMVRLPDYQKLDLRMNKSKLLKHGKMTLFVEGINVTDHANYRFDSYNGYDAQTKQAYISLSQMFPILPSAGMMFEF
jgi:hypothetical protein